DFLDSQARPVVGNEISHWFRPDGGDRIGHQRDIWVVLGEEAGAGSGLVEQKHLVVARNRHRRRGQYRTGIGNQEVDLVLGDKLVIERRSGRGIALIIVSDELDRELLAE